MRVPPPIPVAAHRRPSARCRVSLPIPAPAPGRLGRGAGLPPPIPVAAHRRHWRGAGVSLPIPVPAWAPRARCRAATPDSGSSACRLGEVPGCHPRFRFQLLGVSGEVPGCHPRYRLQLIVGLGEVPGCHLRFRFPRVIASGEVPGCHRRFRFRACSPRARCRGATPDSGCSACSPWARCRGASPDSDRHGARPPRWLPSYARWRGDIDGPDLPVPIAPQPWCRWIVVPPRRVLGCHRFLPGSRFPADGPHFICRGMKWESAIRTAINIVPRRTAHRTPTTPTSEIDARPTPACAVVCRFISTTFL